MKTLWVLLILGQLYSAGNMNYQQEEGYYEINSIYPKHPSKTRVYTTKAIEIAGVYGLTKIFPRYEKTILIGANVLCWGFIIDDRRKGISVKVRF